MYHNKEIISNSNLHFEYELWIIELFFWKEELKFFNIQLSELATRWIKKEVMVQLENFQNEFILHGGSIEDLLEATETHETQINGQPQENQETSDKHLIEIHLDLRKHMEMQRQIYINLKKDFFRFLTKFM